MLLKYEKFDRRYHPFNEYINLNEEIKETPILQKIIDFSFQFSNERKVESF